MLPPPSTPDPRLMEAMRLHAAGQCDEARARYETLLKDAVRGSEFDFHVRRMLSKLYAYTGEIDPAIALLEPLLDQHPAILSEFFTLCLSHNRPKPVLQVARRMLRKYPEDLELHELMASAHELLGQYREALLHLAWLLKADSKREPAFYIRYIRALHRAGELEQAERIIGKGLALYPDSEGLLECQALALALIGRPVEAAECYRHIAKNYPENTQATALAGAMSLLASDFAQGFEEYAARPQIGALERGLVGYLPKWEGESLAGKRLLLWCEQGVGDVVMFTGFVPWLQAQGAHITVVVAMKLVALLRRSFPDVAVLSDVHIAQSAPPDFDCHLPMGDLIRLGLPHYVPAEHPAYLKADRELSAHLRARYAGMAENNGKTHCVGIAWHTANPESGFVRSIPLEQWQEVLSLSDVQCVSLQYGDHVEEIEAINRQFSQGIYCDPSIDAFDDVDGLAAQIMALDAVVTIDNFTAHLAGALGAPVTVLIPAMPDWRWGKKGAQCRWYQHMVLERQQKALQWKTAITHVASSLL